MITITEALDSEIEMHRALETATPFRRWEFENLDRNDGTERIHIYARDGWLLQDYISTELEAAIKAKYRHLIPK